MMGSDGEGGLDVEVDILQWTPNTFFTREGAHMFLDRKRDCSDGIVHKVSEFEFIVFTRKEPQDESKETNS